MESARAGRSLLIFHPAGAFFALAAVMAAVLPWLWLFPLNDARLTHVRLGLFGFGGMAICGYIMTAQLAWTGRPISAPVLPVAVLALGGRLACLVFSEDLWPLYLSSLPVGFVVLWPVLRARRWDKVPLAMVPLTLVVAESMLFARSDLAGVFPLAIAALVFLVGGRLVRAFAAEARRRRGLGAQPRPPLWVGTVLLGVGLLHEGEMGAFALFAAIFWVAVSCLDGLRLGQANRMLCLGYAGLVPGLLATLAARSGLVSQMVQVHVLTMATMGPMILAIVARVTMRRSTGAELVPRRRHWCALALVFCATVARCLAIWPGPATIWLSVAGLGWSAAWILIFSVHMKALLEPAPFPLLSAERAPRTKHPRTPQEFS